MADDPWDPTQYARFRDERSRPFFDLLGLITPRPLASAVDLGCGTGELTRHLHGALQIGSTVGVDSSAAMLNEANAHVTEGLRFELGAIEGWQPIDPVDLVFSNAALHWVDDHASLIARLASSLTPQGQLAVQVPSNHDGVTHVPLAQVAAEEPFRTWLDGWALRSPVLPIAAYATQLDDLGFARQHVREQVYLHHLADRDAIIEWVRGTTLTAYQQRFDDDDRYAQFVESCREQVRAMVPDQRPFPLPFKRTLLWAARD